MIITKNPATGKELHRYETSTPADTESVLNRLKEGYKDWQNRPVQQRAEKLRQLAELLKERKEGFARLISLEMGKPVTESTAEVEKSHALILYYAEKAEAMLDKRFIAIGDDDAYVRYDPLGVILAVMPWNFPLWQVVRAVIPALMAGNTVLLKHASNVTGCGLEIERLFHDAGLIHEFGFLILSGKDILPVASDDRIAGATLTGSESAGRALASVCGEKLKPVVLELGGSDPFLVLEDADIQKAAAVAASSRLINSGQSCIAAKRFIVHQSVFDDFIGRMQAEMEKSKSGDPLDQSVTLGPLAREDLKEELLQQVENSSSSEVIWKSKTAGDVSGNGHFFPPQILLANENDPVWKEETFGPVAAVQSFDTTDAGIGLANRSRFGLGATVFTSDTDRAHDIAQKLQAGSVSVNGLLRSDMRLPFGGIKASGFGRELSKEGIHAFVNIKSVRISNS